MLLRFYIFIDVSGFEFAKFQDTSVVLYIDAAFYAFSEEVTFIAIDQLTNSP